MCLMKSRVVAVAAMIAGMMVCATPMAAQTGSLEFIARARPSDGLEEPVRGFPFYLLSKSFEEIGKEADADEPKPDMDAFIAKLEVSPELKAWMTKNKSVTLSGEDFIRKLKPDDVLGVPEFLKAYMDRNAGDQSTNFPQTKAKASDKVKNPAKYQQYSDEYTATLRRFIVANPQTVDGIDLNLTEIDPGPKWTELLGKRIPEIHRRTIDLAQSKYLVAQTETDVQGEEFLRGIPPGTYGSAHSMSQPTLATHASAGTSRRQFARAKRRMSHSRTLIPFIPRNLRLNDYQALEDRDVSQWISQLAHPEASKLLLVAEMIRASCCKTFLPHHSQVD